MEKIIINGGNPLKGTITVSGAKNAVLPIMAASLLAEGPCRLMDIPRLADVTTMSEVLGFLGGRIVPEGPQEMEIDCSEITSVEAPYEYVRRMRASFLVMGPLLARVGRARMSLPGGCAIGTRPIDLHLKGFAALGASISIGHGSIEATAPELVGARVYLDFPSVGATENIMMAAALAKGVTVIENAAEEPEIVDLANFLCSMGARVMGAGTKIIKIEGVKHMRGVTHGVIPDRIEAGTYMVMAAATGGDVLVDNVITDHLKPVVAKLAEAGVQVKEEGSGIRVRSSRPLCAVDIKTLPYPGFPTDMQAQTMALMTGAQGTSVVTETVFENRFMHVNELKRMGASIIIEGHSAVVKGVPRLTGAKVKATDLRAGAALVVAGLMADGETEIAAVQHIDRGYENMVQKLQAVGADITREERDGEECRLCD
ncbi:UDP-N-acetylglucosamine 1-carboxyvinyltransferase [Clostridiales bacterium PH28_bin88]|nr:UDP-N-acetylglucosamine 1-carboxyvinyltransferase [Clostridiales bacterium PH28_bin88]